MLRSQRSSKPSGLSFAHVALGKRGPTLALDVRAGSTLAVMGLAASGKSKVLRICAGSESPARGEVIRHGKNVYIEEPEWMRRDTPISIARGLVGKGSLQRVSEAISALGLWDFRQKACVSLTRSQQSAASFLPALLGGADLVCIDQAFDNVDWLVLENLWSAFQELRRDGAVIAYATHRPDLGERADHVLVLKSESFAFSGSPETLKRTMGSTQLTVGTQNRPGVRAIADAFDVELEETSDGLRITAKEGQALAAKLISEGYGDVRYILQRAPTFAEALARITTL
jgi:ABC-type multidrug transport system ATPase subunit